MGRKKSPYARKIHIRRYDDKQVITIMASQADVYLGSKKHTRIEVDLTSAQVLSAVQKHYVDNPPATTESVLAFREDLHRLQEGTP